MSALSPTITKHMKHKFQSKEHKCNYSEDSNKGIVTRHYIYISKYSCSVFFHLLSSMKDDIFILS